MDGDEEEYLHHVDDSAGISDYGVITVVMAGHLPVVQIATMSDDECISDVSPLAPQPERCTPVKLKAILNNSNLEDISNQDDDYDELLVPIRGVNTAGQGRKKPAETSRVHRLLPSEGEIAWRNKGVLMALAH